jgi:hypothetical protein
MEKAGKGGVKFSPGKGGIFYLWKSGLGQLQEQEKMQP